MIFKTSFFDALVEAARTGFSLKQAPESDETITIKREKLRLHLDLALAFPKLVLSLKSLNTRKVYFSFSDTPIHRLQGPLSHLSLSIKDKQVDLILASHGGQYTIVAGYVNESAAVYQLVQYLKTSNAQAA